METDDCCILPNFQVMHDTPTDHSSLARAAGLIKLARPTHWVKNSFVLAPLLFSGEFVNAASIGNALLAALLFCVGTSTAYIINDLHDVERDRRHPVKSRSRPIAAGVVSAPAALILLAALYAILIFGWFFAPRVVTIIAGYLLLNLAYTLVLKHQPVIDIFTIAIGFVLRVYAGAIALNVPVSSWMFITTLCLALYLAAVKRRQELILSGVEGREVLEKISVLLVDRYAQISATGALIFYSLFVMSTRPDLVLTIPLVLFGLFRYWFVAEVLERGESPTDVLLTDWQLLLTVLLWVAVCGWAIWPGR